MMPKSLATINRSNTIITIDQTHVADILFTVPLSVSCQIANSLATLKYIGKASILSAELERSLYLHVSSLVIAKSVSRRPSDAERAAKGIVSRRNAFARPLSPTTEGRLIRLG